MPKLPLLIAKPFENSDPRDLQILFLGLFLILGLTTRDWQLRPEMILVTLGSCLAAQALATWGDFRGFKSALVTSLSLCLLLRSDQIGVMMLASGSAILSKFLLRLGDKHCFNPANFGILTVLCLTTHAWVSPGQWGEDHWYWLLFGGAGGLVLNWVGRWDTTAVFLGLYATLEGIRTVWLGWTPDVWVHRLSSGSLLLFALFMITDPRSMPNARIGRVIWAGSVAVLAFVLRNQFFNSSAVFWALFSLAPLVILLDQFWTAPRFTWLPSRLFQESLS